MITLLTLPAFAADVTWTCPTLATAADAIDFRDVESVGARDFIEAAATLPGAWFDATCPAAGTTSTDACHTAAGDAIAIAVSDSGYQVVVVPAAGDLTRFDGDWYSVSYYDVETSQSRDDAQLTTTWAGEVSTELPPDVSLTASALAALGYFRVIESEWTATWDDGTCAWSVAETRTAVGPDDAYSWEIEVGSQTLTVTEDPTDACTPTGATAVLDGVMVFVEPGTWEPVSGVDADGDGWPADKGDCDDADPVIAPCQLDLACDGIDQDCDGGDSPDCDGDGHDPVEAGGDDCDDTDADIHPGASDVSCDGTDQDCDGFDRHDADSDGHGRCEDCDDRDAGTYPGASDVSCDGTDQDCDGFDRQDGDADGYGGCDDCDDADAGTYPGAVEVPGDGIDQDCDGADLPDPEDTANDTGTAADTDSGMATDSDSGTDSAPSPSAPASSEPRDVPSSHACQGCDSGAGPAWVGLLTVLLSRRRAR